ncbi:unnamed protein product [Thlaspi arvense]|uniref:Uncharacterized protein n=1 Tax=Thlaspi arvense TaxID=13288 RepID=A0AAU9SDQ4_THLAR|nr:unnamed protein product [Thlaspi arvense]
MDFHITVKSTAMENEEDNLQGGGVMGQSSTRTSSLKSKHVGRETRDSDRTHETTFESDQRRTLLSSSNIRLFAITIDDDDDETLDQKNSKRDDQIDSPTFNSLGSLPSTDAFIVNDEEKETLERKKNKKLRLESWCDEAEDFNELTSVVKGLPKAKEDNDAQSRVDHHEKKKDDERSLSTSRHDNNFIDLSKDKSVGESTSSGNKGNEHVSLEELGVSVEDLKIMPWGAFDPTWEIRSETMDPWLGSYFSRFLAIQWLVLLHIHYYSMVRDQDQTIHLRINFRIGFSAQHIVMVNHLFLKVGNLNFISYSGGSSAILRL